ncbi:beta-galactoside alpha-2,6-sialyltransferase 2 isoform X2 [Glossina fuscipes]|uniref:Beta-galactoside alpha-2,6-sialyltransferase 1 n=1 Tax=Glossina fuscipes TaxID=7396 RepID=A0A9C6DYX5_9MUSC|nr:beta-galactoside alpha-2,6-sialyltransferase 2 isoform X2 [Glossina fuscipes]XP_037897167.1 beta-galactoside alpha-2,6-sialyltransferase 2 isoform X2 [Glossina fuscipes]XP_037897168.1 beta-galactoside alpha-2,6-sialyltransferase 2 isoform X2 [Glossina fuscipes]XP_037897169.1 beta-galactoside alpha-2,6-sialyltransferase 2 isoform X2 [Glossina fuscipes]
MKISKKIVIYYNKMFKNFFKIILNASIIVVIIITIQTKSENADCAKTTKNNNSSNRNSGSNNTCINENYKELMKAAFFINTTDTRSQHAQKRQNESLPHKAGLCAKKRDYFERGKRSVFHVRWNPNEKYIVESLENPAVNSSKYSPHPRLKVSKTTKISLNPKIYLCRDKYELRCLNKTLAFRERIIKTLEKAVIEVVNETNHYNVDFKPVFGSSFEEQYYPSSCLMMEADVRVLRRKDHPFNKLQFGKLFPKQKLFRHSKKIKACAIVSSAGSMAGSKLGRFIDTHDVVMRFNHAPTRGYETDVGSKTTIRVVNSQVVTKTEFDFAHAPIFQNVTIAAWDPGKYNASLEDWLTTSDYDLFSNYEIYRRRYPKSRAFLVNPHSIWRLWQSLQTFAGNRLIRKNPPSSGFIGLALLLPYCSVVHFIEYIPSTRLNGRCHYYSKEINSACTFGSWHPLAAEKLMALDMNIADDISVFQYGILRIKRPNKLLCGFNFLGY